METRFGEKTLVQVLKLMQIQAWRVPKLGYDQGQIEIKANQKSKFDEKENGTKTT